MGTGPLKKKFPGCLSDFALCLLTYPICNLERRRTCPSLSALFLPLPAKTNDCQRVWALQSAAQAAAVPAPAAAAAAAGGSRQPRASARPSACHSVQWKDKQQRQQQQQARARICWRSAGACAALLLCAILGAVVLAGADTPPILPKAPTHSNPTLTLNSPWGRRLAT